MQEKPIAQYTVKDIRLPVTKDRVSDVEWICQCFGFMEFKDEERTATRVFKALLDAGKTGKGLTSQEIARKVKLTRGAVVHHLNRMIRSGLVIRRGSYYELRVRSLEKTVEEVERDITRVFENLKAVAREIDDSMNMPRR